MLILKLCVLLFTSWVMYHVVKLCVLLITTHILVHYKHPPEDEILHGELTFSEEIQKTSDDRSEEVVPMSCKHMRMVIYRDDDGELIDTEKLKSLVCNLKED